MTEGTLLAAFLLGLAGSTHCLGMCGGIMAALAFRHEKLSLGLIAGYNLGRILGYGVIGLVFGSAMALLQSRWPFLGPALRIAAALMLVAMGLYLCGWTRALTPLESLGQRLWQRLPHPSLATLGPGQFGRACLTGIAWGWLPCGLVYSTLAWASMQGQGWHSAVLMMAFGVGTLPSMMAAGMLANRLGQWLKQRQWRITSGLLVIAFGLWTLWMPVGHHSHTMSHDTAAPTVHSHPMP